jgi:retinol dehydrogenase-12
MEISTLALIIVSLIIVLYLLRRYLNGPATSHSKSMINKTVIVTGSNTGIGKETAFDLLEKGARVIFACRDETRTMKSIDEVSNKKFKENAFFMKLDISSYSSIDGFVKDFKKRFGKCDVLVNNAGGMNDGYHLREGIESTIKVNHIGTVYLTALLLDHLNPEAMVVNVSSKTQYRVTPKLFEQYLTTTDFSNGERTHSPWYSYCFSKICNVFHAMHLDFHVKKKGLKIKTASLNPGIVASDFYHRSETLFWKFLWGLVGFVKFFFFKDNIMGAQTTLHVIYSDYDKLNSAAFFMDCAERKKNNLCDDWTNVDRVMQYTKTLIFQTLNDVPQEVKDYLNSI